LSISQNHRNFGFPQQFKPDPWTATFACIHRDTKRPICSTPCDGRDDLCEDMLDEQCAVPPVLEVLLWVAVATISGICGLEVVAVILDKTDSREVGSLSSELCLIEKERNREVIVYEEIRKSPQFGQAFINMILYHNHTDYPADVKTLCQKYYGLEEKFQKGSAHKVDRFYFATLKTNSSTSLFYDHLEGSLMITIQNWITAALNAEVVKLLNSLAFKKVQIMTHCCFGTLLHYTDLVKDLLLVTKLGMMMVSSEDGFLHVSGSRFPCTVLAVICTSIIMSELANILTLTAHPEFSEAGRKKRCLLLIFLPAGPAYIRHKESRLLREQAILIHDIPLCLDTAQGKSITMNSIEARLSLCESKLTSLRILRSEIRSNENVLEHFVQLVVLIVILLVDLSSTKVDVSLGKFFLHENEGFLAFSAIISFVSLVRGHLFYIEAKNHVWLPIKGKAIQFVYFLLSILVRVFYIILFFTPRLGLFETLKFVQMGRLKGTSFPIYDITQRGQALTLVDVWNDKFLMMDFSEAINKVSPAALLISIPIVLLFLHLAITYKINSPVLPKAYGLVAKLKCCLYSLVCPPLFLDWIDMVPSPELSGIGKSWNKVMKAFACHTVLFSLEHIILCIPLFLLNSLIQTRFYKMSEYFQPLSEEALSAYAVTCLMYAGITISVLFPLVQLTLALLYFRLGHPWSRILRRRDTANDQQGNDQIIDVASETQLKNVETAVETVC
jgi:hypothetical protein